MAKSKKLESTLTSFLSDAIDDTKKVIDDIIKSAGSVESKARKAAGDLRDKLPTDADIKRLRKRLEDLSKQIDKLVSLKGEGAKPAKKTAAAAKAPAKKTPAKKTAAKKAPAKKATAKKAPAKKTTAKKAPAKKTTSSTS